jgi:hypothetical protein
MRGPAMHAAGALSAASLRRRENPTFIVRDITCLTVAPLLSDPLGQFVSALNTDARSRK